MIAISKGKKLEGVFSYTLLLLDLESRAVMGLERGLRGKVCTYCSCRGSELGFLNPLF